MGFVAGDEIEAVPAMELPLYEFCGAPYRYRACNGYHRFYASIAAGFRESRDGHGSQRGQAHGLP